MDSKRQNLVDVFLKYNAQVNLSAIRTPEGVYTKHVLDSLELLKILKIEPGTRILDVGTGGGFPLLPLAIENPAVQFTGIDARRKKVDIVNKMIAELDIKNAKAIRTRAEEFKDRFDIVMARAVAFAEKLLPWVLPLVENNGKIVLYKQQSDEEFKKLNQICKKQKLKLTKIHHYTFSDDDIQRVIFVLQK